MASVFLSFSTRDRAWAEWVAWALGAEGVTVRVLSRPEEEAGKEWPAEIERSMEEARHCLALLSSNYGESRWCSRERRLAQVLEVERDRYFVPLRIDGHSEVEGFLRLTSWIDVVGLDQAATRSALARLIDSLGIERGERRNGVGPPFPGARRATNRSDERRRLLGRARDRIETGLDLLLAHRDPLRLSLARRHDVLGRSAARRLVDADRREVLAEHSRLLEVADPIPGGGLLVLGAPGSGKTVELLELARERLERATLEPGVPIPFVFDLAPFRPSSGGFGAWLRQQLHDRHAIPHALADRLIDKAEIDVLLDGLDEVEEQHRDPCLEAIARFNRSSDCFVALTSRSSEFRELRNELGFQRAVEVLPLSPSEVREVVHEAGESAAELDRQFARDPALVELARSPLVLRLLLLSADRLTADDLATDQPARLRARLFDRFLESMASRRGLSEERITELRGFLGWLARGMTKHDSSAFYLEHLQGSWLPSTTRRYAEVGQRAVLALLDGITFGSIGGVTLGWISGFGVNLGGAALVGLAAALGGSLLPLRPIRPLQPIRWSSLLSRRGLAGAALSGVLLGGLLYVLALPFRPDHASLLAGTGAVGGAIAGAIFSGATRREIGTRRRPNDGIVFSAQNSLWALATVGVLVAAVSIWFCGIMNERFVSNALRIWHGPAALDLLPESLLFSLGCGLVAARWFGGGLALRHLLLRGLLAPIVPRAGLRATLDSLASMIVLTRRPGAYGFLHSSLREHFAGSMAPTSHPSPRVLTWGLRVALTALLVATVMEHGNRLFRQARARHLVTRGHVPTERERFAFGQRSRPTVQRCTRRTRASRNGQLASGRSVRARPLGAAHPRGHSPGRRRGRVLCDRCTDSVPSRGPRRYPRAAPSRAAPGFVLDLLSRSGAGVPLVCRRPRGRGAVHRRLRCHRPLAQRSRLDTSQHSPPISAPAASTDSARDSRGIPVWFEQRAFANIELGNAERALADAEALGRLLPAGSARQSFVLAEALAFAGRWTEARDLYAQHTRATQLWASLDRESEAHLAAGALPNARNDAWIEQGLTRTLARFPEECGPSGSSRRPMVAPDPRNNSKHSSRRIGRSSHLARMADVLVALSTSSNSDCRMADDSFGGSGAMLLGRPIVGLERDRTRSSEVSTRFVVANPPSKSELGVPGERIRRSASVQTFSISSLRLAPCKRIPHRSASAGPNPRLANLERTHSRTPALPSSRSWTRITSFMAHALRRTRILRCLTGMRESGSSDKRGRTGPSTLRRLLWRASLALLFDDDAQAARDLQVHWQHGRVHSRGTDEQEPSSSQRDRGLCPAHRRFASPLGHSIRMAIHGTKIAAIWSRQSKPICASRA